MGTFLAAVGVLACCGQASQQTADAPAATIESAVPPPAGYERIAAEPGSFGAWLRKLRVRAGHPPVLLYDGRKKANQTAHYAVLDVDVGPKDLQQCADAVIRLRAEYLFAGPCRDEIRFDFTSGDTARWTDWRQGMRPIVTGNRVSWKRNAAADDGYSSFRAYLDTVFTYAGSASLERELLPVADPARPEIGDVFIQGGFPGHAVIVVDVAENRAGRRAFLLAQSYMPAQDIHVLKSFEDVDPWYRARPAGVLRTPEWRFRYEDLKRFAYTACEALMLTPARGGEAPPPEITTPWVPTIEGPQYFAVRVADAGASAAWYRAVFGLEEVDRASAEDGSWEILNLRNDHLLVEIIRDDRAASVDRARGFFKVGFRVPDVEAVADAVERTAGERPRVVDVARHGVRLVQIRDPDGNVIQLFSRIAEGP